MEGRRDDARPRAPASGSMVEFRDRDGAPISDLDVTAPFRASVRRGAGSRRRSCLRRPAITKALRRRRCAGPLDPVIEASRGGERLFRSENKLAVGGHSAPN